jgi:hypothetical protein
MAGEKLERLEKKSAGLEGSASRFFKNEETRMEAAQKFVKPTIPIRKVFV